ncbi:MAG: PDZ domain-containing protein [bacterium]|jgi:S1-C subfamily serine protease|nr:PDZ domain-containing protein [bacterium]
MKHLTFLLVVVLLSCTSRAAEHAFLGIVPEKSVPVNAQGFSGAGLLIKQVVAKGPAAEVGIKGGDILTHFNGKPIEDGDDLSFFLRRSKPGDKVSLDWIRGDSRQKGDVRLGARDEPELRAKAVAQLGKAMGNTAYLGIGSLSINNNLLTYFGVKENHGILIDAVVKGSPADKAGLKVGDVLVSLDGRAVDSPGRLRRLLQDYRPGAKARLELVRNRQVLQVDLVIGSREQSSLDPLESPRLPKLRGMPEMPDWPELPSVDVLGDLPGRVAVDSTLNLLRRLIGPPLALLER